MEDLAHEGSREGELDVCAKTDMAGQLELKPAGHALALHEDDFGLQRRRRRGLQSRGQLPGQHFQPITGVQDQSMTTEIDWRHCSEECRAAGMAGSFFLLRRYVQDGVVVEE